MSDDLLARLRKYDAYDCCDQRVEAADEIGRLRAKVEHLQKALERIANGDVPRTMGERWRSDGAPSKHDTCTHRKPMWMECPHCVEEYARSEQENRL